MRNGLWLGLGCVLLAGLSAAANIIIPSGGQANLLIEGRGEIADGEHNIPGIYFKQSGTWSGSPIGQTFIQAQQDIATPETPDFGMQVSATSGVEFYHSAPNQMVVILHASPAAQLTGAAFNQQYFYSDFSAHANTKINGVFQVDLMPGQEYEDYVDLLINVEYLGDLSRSYYAKASTTAKVTVYPTPCQGWNWSHTAATNGYNPGVTDPMQNVSVNETVNLPRSAFAGGAVSFSAELDCTAMMDWSVNKSNFIGIDTFAANSGFDPGLKITMTVLPEPATMSLLLAGGMLLARRHRR